MCNCNHKERKFPCKVVYLQILQTQMIESELKMKKNGLQYLPFFQAQHRKKESVGH